MQNILHQAGKIYKLYQVCGDSSFVKKLLRNLQWTHQKSFSIFSLLSSFLVFLFLFFFHLFHFQSSDVIFKRHQHVFFIHVWSRSGKTTVEWHIFVQVAVDILQQTSYQQADIRMRSHGLRQLVDDKSVGSSQQTCCKLIVKTCYPQACCKLFQQVATSLQMTSCNKPWFELWYFRTESNIFQQLYYVRAVW